MKRWLTLFAVLCVGAAVLVLAERRHADTQASPDAILHLVADAEREANRLPARVWRLSDAQEIEVGDEMARQYLAGAQFQDENANAQQIQAYVDHIGMLVSVHARRRLAYRFHYVADPSMVNAFALPGGHIFIGEGLMRLMRHEDELAAVLGHEVEHVDLFHCAERVQFEAQMRRLHLEAISDLASIPISVFKAGYSKELELEADREGTRLAVEAGYSPQGAISLFQAMEERYRGAQQQRPGSPEEEAEQVAAQTLEDYFRSHPPTGERIRELEAFNASQGWPVKPEKPLSPEVQLALGSKREEGTVPPRVLR